MYSIENSINEAMNNVFRLLNNIHQRNFYNNDNFQIFFDEFVKMDSNKNEHIKSKKIFHLKI